VNLANFFTGSALGREDAGPPSRPRRRPRGEVIVDRVAAVIAVISVVGFGLLGGLVLAGWWLA